MSCRAGQYPIDEVYLLRYPTVPPTASHSGVSAIYQVFTMAMEDDVPSDMSVVEDFSGL